MKIHGKVCFLILLMRKLDRYAIETMQSVCLKEAGVNAPGTLEEETTMVGLTFGGYLRSKVIDGQFRMVVLIFFWNRASKMCLVFSSLNTHD